MDTDDQAIAALQHELTKQKPVCDPVAQDNARAGSQSIKVPSLEDAPVIAPPVTCCVYLPT